VAIQGEPGCNSALAAAQWFGRPTLVPCPSFAAMFNALVQDQADFAMAPVENSLGGLVVDVWELLVRQRPAILGEMYLQVRHCLIAHPGVPIHQVRFIYSHEQALAQCQRYIRSLVWLEPDHVVAVYDTAGAVKMIKARGRREEAAIATPGAARLYDMQVLAEDIQTDPRNFTRFLLLAARPAANAAPDVTADPALPTTSIVVTLTDCARQLPQVLACLLAHRLPVHKVETRKRVGVPWEYWVVVEFGGHAQTPSVAGAVQELEGLAAAVQILGSYPAAARP
jgi:prephenate dehydratase